MKPKSTFMRLLLLVALALPWTMQAQSPVSDYSLAVSTDVYSSIATPTNGGSSTATYVDIDMPFDMTFGVTAIATHSTLRAYPDGHAEFTGLTDSKLEPLSATTFTNTPAAIHYVANSSGVTVEWRKMVAGNTSISFQMKLFPDGTIEFHYGPATISGTLSAYTGLQASSSDKKYYTAAGWTSTSTSTSRSSRSISTSAYNTTTLSGPVFTFTKPTCLRPAKPTVTATSYSSINVSWTGNTGNFQVCYSTSASFTSGSQTDTVSVNNATSKAITDLYGNTKYYVKVRRVCGPGEISSWSDTAQVTTPAPPCAAVTVTAQNPFLENFNSYSGNSTSSSTPSGYPSIVMPSCWNVLQMSATSSTYPQVFLSSFADYAVSGNCLFFRSSKDSAAYVVMPQFSNAIQTLQLCFTYRNEGVSGSNGTLSYGIMTDPTDISTFVEIASLAQTITKTNVEHPFNNDNVTGTGKYIAFKYTGGSANNYYCGIDNISVELIPTCTKPSGLTASNVTGSSVELAWTENGNATAWEVIYGVSGFDPATTGTVVPAPNNPFTLTGLNGATTYDVYVRSSCSETNKSKWSADVASFTTSCGIMSLPYSEDFNSYTTKTSTGTSAPTGYPNITLPLCWSFLNMSSTTSTYPQIFISSSSTYAVSGKCLFFRSSKDSAAFAILPQFSNAIETMQLTFTYRNEGTTASNGTLSYGYMTDPTDASTFVEVASLARTTTKTEVNHAFDNDNVTGTGKYIAFKYTGGSSNNYYLGIDNVVVDLIPNCTKPQSLATSALTPNSATVTWTAGDNVANWTLRYSTKSTFDPDTASNEVTGTTGNSATIEGLSPLTTYYVYVKTDCGTEGTSAWSSIFSFTTPCESATLPFSENFDTWTSKSTCWSFLSGQYNYGAGPATTYASAWTLSSSYGDYITLEGQALAMNLYSTNRYWAVTPNIEITSDNVQLSVDVAVSAWSAATPNYDDNDTLAFAISTNGGATYTNLRTLNGTQLNALGNTYTTLTTPIIGYNGQTVRIAIFGGSISGTSPHDNRIVIDNVVVEKTPTCGKPAEFTSNVTASSANISWTVPTIGTPSTYDVAYGLHGFDLEGMSMSDYISVDENSVTLPGLHYNTSYDVYVRTVCNAADPDPSAWSNVYTFTTNCKSSLTVDDLPFTETFDGHSGFKSYPYYGPAVLPHCWEFYSNGTNTPETESTSLYYGGVGKYSGTSYGSLENNNPYLYMPIQITGPNVTSQSYIDYETQRGNTKYAVMPQYTGNLNTLQISFDYKMSTAYSATGAATVLELGYVTDATDITTFHSLVSYNAVSTIQSVKDLALDALAAAAPAGSSLAFRFSGEYNSTGSYAYTTVHCGIDNIVLKQIDQTHYLLANQTVTTCEGIYAADTAAAHTGNGGHYATGTHTYTFQSANPGNVVRLTGSYDVETGYDFIKVYYGSVAEANLLGTYTGKGSIDVVSPSHEWATKGKLIVQLVADNDDDFGHTGFNLTASCECPAQDPNTILDSIVTNQAYTWSLRPNRPYPVKTVTDANDISSHYTDGPFTQKGVGFDEMHPTGCDSIYRRLDLTIYNSFNLSVSADICARESYSFYGNEYTATGIYTDTLTSSHGTDSISTLSLTVHSAPDVYIYYNNRNVTAPITGVCDGAALTLEGRSNNTSATFTWNDGSVEATHVVYPNDGDTVTVFSTESAYNCTSLPVSVVINTTPVASPAIFASDTVICRGDSVTLNAVDQVDLAGVTYRWNTGATTATIKVAPTATTTYRVTATANGCNTIAEQLVTVNQLPEVAIATSANQICLGDSLVLTAESVNGYTYAWDIPGGTGYNTNIAKVIPTTVGNYTASLTVTDQNGCQKQFSNDPVAVRPSYNMDVEAVECTQNLPYQFGTQSLSHDTVTTEVFTIAYGCDSVVNLTFSILDTAVTNTYRELCYGTEFTFGEGIYQQTYTAVANNVYTYLDTLGSCPARYTLYLTVHPVRTTNLTQTVCDSLVWNGTVYTTSGNYTQNLLTNYGCDSTVNVALTVNTSSYPERTIAACDSLVWNDSTYYVAGDYVQQFTNMYGCDSVETVHLTAINHATYRVDTLCATAPYTWIDGETYNLSEKSGYIKAVYDTTPEGCNAYAILNLTVNMPVDTLVLTYDTVCDNYTVDTVACTGELVEFTITEPGRYNLRVPDSSGLSTVIKPVDIFIRESGHTTLAVTACVPYMHTWIDGTEQLFTQSTVATHEGITTGSECPMVERLVFTANMPDIRYIDTTVCGNADFYYRDFFNNIHNSKGSEAGEYHIATYVDTTDADNIAANGCPYSDTLRLTVLEGYDVNVKDMYFCQTEFSLDEDTNSATYGMYITTVPDKNHPDTVITFAYDGTLNYGIINYDVLTYSYPLANGCDSIVNIEWYILANDNSVTSVTECVSYTWDANDAIYTAVVNQPTTEIHDSVIYSGVIEWNTSEGVVLCDSVSHLMLTLYDTIRDTNFYYPCTEYTYNGQTYRESHIFYEDVPNLGGCPERHYDMYTIGQREWIDEYYVSSDPLPWRDGNVYKTTSEAFYSEDGVGGACERIYNLHFTKVDTAAVSVCNVVLPVTTSFGLTIDSAFVDSVMLYGNPERGVYYCHYHVGVDSANNVDSLITVAIATGSNVTDIPGLTEEVACDSYTWINGVTYTADTNVAYAYTDKYGCASRDSLHLVMQYNNNQSYTVTECDSYQWSSADWNNTIDTAMTKSGTYYHSYVAANLCPSVDTLYLTINKHIGDSLNITVCDRYGWPNSVGDTTWYTASGVYYGNRADANGCIGYDTVKLTVNKSVEYVYDTIVNSTVCTYRGVLYQLGDNPSGYTETVTTHLTHPKTGCDSVIVMNIHFYQGGIENIDTIACGIFEWDKNGHTYKWISSQERMQHNMALYYDITDSVYVMANPIYNIYNTNPGPDSGSVVHTYVLWLTLNQSATEEVNIARYPMATQTSYTYKGTVLPLDFTTVGHDTVVYRQIRRELVGFSLCDSVYNLTFHMVWNVDSTYRKVCATLDTIVLPNSEILPLGPADTAGKNDTTFTMYVANPNTDSAWVHYIGFFRTGISQVTVTDTNVHCDSYTWRDTTYQATSVLDRHEVVTLCDSVVTLNFKLHKTDHNVYTLSRCVDSYVWKDNSGDTIGVYTASGIYSHITDTVLGCQYIDTLDLTLLPTPDDMAQKYVVDECNTYTWVVNTVDLIADTIKPVTVGTYVADTNVAFTYAYALDNGGNACQTTDSLFLTIRHDAEPTYTTLDTVYGGPGTSYRLDGVLYYYPHNAVHPIHYEAANGCDSIDYVRLIIKDYKNVTDQELNACAVYVWERNGHTYEWIDNVTSQAHGDALYYDATESEYVLENPTYLDSEALTRYTLILSLHPSNVVVNADTNILLSQHHDGIALINGIASMDGIDSNETLHKVFSVGAGDTDCDTTWYYTINVTYNYTDHYDTICFNQDTIKRFGKVVDMTVKTAGASFDVYDTVSKGTANEWVTHYNVYRRVFNEGNATLVACDSLNWKGVTYTAAGGYGASQTFTLADSTFTDQYGCDSLAHPTLTVYNNNSHGFDTTVCDSYKWNATNPANVANGTRGTGETYTVSGTYTKAYDYAYTGTNVKCPSVDTLKLVVNYNSSKLLVVNACDSYTWPTNLENPLYHGTGVTYDSSRLDTNRVIGPEYLTAKHCPSADTLQLTVNYSEPIYDTQYVSEGYQYVWRGYDTIAGNDSVVMYTVDGTDIHEHRYYNFPTCDRDYYLHLRIAPMNVTTMTVTDCHSYTWIDGNTYVYLSEAERAAHNNALYYNATQNSYQLYNPTKVYHRDGDFDSVIMLMLTLTEWVDGNDVINFPASLGELSYGDSVFDYTAHKLAMIDSANRGTTPAYGTVLGSYKYDVSFGSPIHCDSVIHLTVNVINDYVKDGSDDICANQGSYVYRDSTYTEEFVNNDYDHNRTVALLYGVANSDTLLNKVYYRLINQHPMTYSTARREACDSYTWAANGETYGEGLHDGSTKTYYGYVTDTNMYGCDSIISLVLNIHYNTSAMDDAAPIACDTVTYTFANANVTRKYAESCFDTAAYLTSYSGYSMKCQSVDTVMIRVAKPVDSVYNVVACDSYKWEATNKTYVRDTNVVKATKRDFTDALFGDQTVKCDVTDTLHLVVNSNKGSKTKDTACDVYTWTAGAYLYNSAMHNRYNKWVIDGDVELSANGLLPNDSSFADPVGAAFDSLFLNETAQYSMEGHHYYYRYYTTTEGCNVMDTLDLLIKKNSNGKHYLANCDTIVYEKSWIFGPDTARDTHTFRQIFTQSDSVLFAYESEVNGCPSVDTLILTVNHSVASSFDTVVCDNFTWMEHNVSNSTLYNFDTVLKHTFYSLGGCDSVVTANVTIGHGTTYKLEEVTACGHYIWEVNGTVVDTLYESGNTSYTFPNPAHGCDSLVYLRLTITEPLEVLDTNIREAVLPFVWRGMSLTESGIYRDTVAGNGECDSIAELHLTVIPTIFIDTFVCYGATYFTAQGFIYDSVDLSQPGVISEYNADSTKHMTLTVGFTPGHVVNNTPVASCESYDWVRIAGIDTNTYEPIYDVVTLTESGEYAYMFKVNSIDATCYFVDSLYLTINHGVGVKFDVNVCSSYTWRDSVYTESGVYTFDFYSAEGCESTDTLVLTVGGGEDIYDTVEACGSYEWHGNVYTNGGNFVYNYQTIDGCTGTEYLNLTVYSVTPAVYNETACASYTWNDSTYTESGDYTYEHTTGNGCTVVDTLHLVIRDNASGIAVTVEACDSYNWNGTTYTESGDYTYEYTDGSGCTGTDTLHLTVNTGTFTGETVTTCESYTWNGTTYTQSGVYFHLYNNEAGCASVDTLNLTITGGISETISATACESYEWNGTTYTASGFYSQTFPSVAGCDSIVTMVLTIKSPVYSTVNVSNCGTYYWEGTLYNTTGTYGHVYSGAASNGCDSIVTLNLTVNEAASSSFNQTACESYNWNGTTYNQSGAYTYTYTTVNGCDSVVTMNLTITPALSSSFSVTTCGTYYWEGALYNTTGTYQHNYTSVTGCDSIVTLYLTITEAITSSFSVTACDSYVWEGTMYTTSGLYQHVYTAYNGCDSIVTMALTISSNITETVSETVCDSYTWNGTTYTASGVYSHTYPAAAGCDSIVTLVLTVNHSAATTVNESACESFTWIDGQTYTESTNTPSVTLYTVAGCDSVVTLSLTINHATAAIDEQAACDGFIWIDGTNYTASTNEPTYTLTGSNGCDSVVTLHLTINHSVEIYDSISLDKTELPYNYRGNFIQGAGDYVFYATTVNGCDSTVYLNVEVRLDGIDDVTVLDELTVYPNPTRGQVTLSAEKVMKVEVLDMVGRIVATYEDTNTFDISDLAAGAYTLRITLPEGTAIRRIVKK